MGTEQNHHSRTELLRMAMGYWHSQVLFTATALGVFSQLSREPAGVKELAAQCGAPFDSLERLLNACMAIGLLEQQGDRYRNSPVAEEFLVEGQPGSLVHWVRLMADWYHPWGNLQQAVTSGSAAELPERHLGGDAAYTRNFILGMHDYASGPGRELVDCVDLTNRTRLLDIGGGPGTYSVLLSQRYPQLRCVVFDLPPIVEIAKELIARSGVSDRVSVQAGDYAREGFEADFDVVLLSNVLHQDDPAAAQALLRKAYAALRSGGIIIVQAMFLNASKNGPMWPALHTLLMLLIHHAGRSYTVEETMEMVTGCGFVEPHVKRMSLVNAGSVILGTKP